MTHSTATIQQYTQRNKQINIQEKAGISFQTGPVSWFQLLEKGGKEQIFFTIFLIVLILLNLFSHTSFSGNPKYSENFQIDISRDFKSKTTKIKNIVASVVYQNCSVIIWS
ncbi:Hypothetical_protein [Hexamita inflata]|uniref:Hypothetical_protein n=1 Tax=Hexamita inflata TaxID=28002 RepID=A0AA86QV26_9EUKA|nr:Hypothetical protein HINF_LOCUS52348 [Hexamita inflata]